MQAVVQVVLKYDLYGPADAMMLQVSLKGEMFEDFMISADERIMMSITRF